jgi:hypothetical protein
MTIFASANSGASWHIAANVYTGYSGYSALVGLNATHAGLLWEITGSPPGGNPCVTVTVLSSMSMYASQAETPRIDCS